MYFELNRCNMVSLLVIMDGGNKCNEYYFIINVGIE